MMDPQYQQGVESTSVVKTIEDIAHSILDGKQYISVPSPLHGIRPTGCISMADDLDQPGPINIQAKSQFRVSRRTASYNISRDISTPRHSGTNERPTSEKEPDTMSDITDAVSRMLDESIHSDSDISDEEVVPRDTEFTMEPEPMDEGLSSVPVEPIEELSVKPIRSRRRIIRS